MLTRHRSRQPAAAGVSLFPFLAVLICTMGALIVLLVVIARQARLQAAQIAAAKADRQQYDLQTAQEDVQWRIEQLRSSRQKTESQLAEARLDLGHLEDHARRLRDRLARLEATLADLDRLGSEGGQQHEELEAELTQVRAAVAEAQRRLDDARQAAARRRRSYAVVPYRGPHQTHRRPIYIECRGDEIILQPEGIVLREEDFDGPMGPGNPLAAALRAAREYLLAQGGFDPEKSGEPYPLLLVRPDSIAAYYAARVGMKSWGSEFGYELIGDDWQLDFRRPDPQLAQVMHRAVETARVRQQQLAAAAPRHYGNRQQRVKYRATPTRGGIVRDNGHGETAVPMRPGEWRPRQESAGNNAAAGQTGQQVKSLAESRGQDWALPDAANASVPLTRAVRIECHADHLVIVPERGLAGRKVVPMGPRTEDAIDEFVSALWQYIKSWGIAGNGMYWRPVLSVNVAPGAEQRYRELSTLLDGSGLKVQRRGN